MRKSSQPSAQRSLSVSAGDKKAFSLPLGQRPSGGALAITVLVARGMVDGPVLCVDAGTHGDEGEGTDAVLRLFSQIRVSDLRGTFVGVPVANPAAFDAMERTNPLDRFSNADLNRVYPGNPKGSLTDRTAFAYFEEVVSASQYAISLHGAGNYAVLAPHVTIGVLDGGQREKTLEFAKSLGWEHIWCGIPYRGMLVDAAPRVGVTTVCAEFGGGGDRLPSARERYVSKAVAAVRNAMVSLGMLPGQAVRPAEWTILEGDGHVFSDVGGLFRPQPDLRLGEPIAEGHPIGSIVDIATGCETGIRAPRSGVLLNIRTFPVVYPGDLLMGIAPIRERVQDGRC